MTVAGIGPILIYRKEVQQQGPDRAGAMFVDNSIALISCGFPMAEHPVDACAGSHPLPRPRTR